MTPGELLLGEYVVERPLGAGGMGHVVLVRDRFTGQRFAVKRARPGSAALRSRLLAELRTWIGLPEFPHLVACRFWRSLGDEVAIFAEYVAGGSLADWIEQRRLRTLADVLDAAIQLAWGLHAAHLLGVVHQDVKPSNALLTPEGLVKVSDFGLAGARFGGALTRGYCAPELAERLAAGGEPRPTPASDQWAWAVTVFEMFLGAPPCPHAGQLAGGVLEHYLARGGQEPGRPRMPELVAEVLRKCFQRRPADRWGTLAEAAEVLAVAYLMATGEPYARAQPAWPAHATVQEHSRRTLGGATWDDPLDWLRRVLREAGEDPQAARAFAPDRGGSRLAQAVADLVPYAEAQRRLTALVQAGRSDLVPLLAELCLARAAVHWAGDDVPGTAHLAAQAVSLLAPLEADHAGLLAAAYLRGAACARVQGRLDEALVLADRSLAVCERAGAQLPASYLAACESRARTHFAREDYPAALAALEPARDRARRLVEEGRADLEPTLADLYLLTGRVLHNAGEPPAALAWLDQAVPILERLVRGGDEYRYTLATAYLTRARLLALRDDPAAAVLDSERCLALFRELEGGDRPELASDIADAHALQAHLLVRLDRPAEALPLYAHAQEVYERLVGQRGRHDLLPALARLLVGRAAASQAAGDFAAALDLGERALGLLEPLVADERSHLASDLAWAQAVHAHSHLALGQSEPALACQRAAVVLYEGLVQGQGRGDLLGSLLRAYRAEARTLADMGRARGALDRLDSALFVAEGLAHGREAAVADWLALRIDRAALLAADGQVPRAQAELCEVLLALEHRADADELRRRALGLLESLL